MDVYRCLRNSAVYHAAPSKRKLRVPLSIAAKLGRGRELQFKVRVGGLLAHLLRREIAPFANGNGFRRWNSPAVLLPRHRLKLPGVAERRGVRHDRTRCRAAAWTGGTNRAV